MARKSAPSLLDEDMSASSETPEPASPNVRVIMQPEPPKIESRGFEMPKHNAILGYIVRAARPQGFWRCKRHFTQEPVRLHVSELSLAERTILEETPPSVLVVEKIYA